VLVVTFDGQTFSFAFDIADSAQFSALLREMLAERTEDVICRVSQNSTGNPANDGTVPWKAELPWRSMTHSNRAIAHFADAALKHIAHPTSASCRAFALVRSSALLPIAALPASAPM
jgi:hypothetical protein